MVSYIINMLLFGLVLEFSLPIRSLQVQSRTGQNEINNWYWYELEHKFHEQFYRAEPELLRNSALTSKLQTLRPSTPSQP